ncbi:MAG: hypothetical protein IK997_06835 [Bacilli bacterium]|nr:hypothetical protein [Bacilli bacterium]
MDIEFKNIKELYNRVHPALTSKKNELKRKGLNIKEEDIWNYLSEKIFRNSTNLTLSDVVSYIMHLEIEDIEEYMTKKA